ncbi:MAG: hypothetical protein AAFN93_04455 [Bacteroidota bacterium]
MNLFNKLWRSNFSIKLRSWEYWPFNVVYLPIYFYWFWLSIKARSFLFFSSSNPGIENAGMLGESKIKILDNIKPELKPLTIFCKYGESYEDVELKLKESELEFPIIAKPDIGERGWNVEKINNEKELRAYISEIPVDYLIQEYLDLPIEMGIFYYRYPKDHQGQVSSITIKEMLSVEGDGKSTLKELILNYDRAKLQWHVLKEIYADSLGQILKKGEKKELVTIGNHSRGTKFLNGNHLINDNLHKTFDEISKGIPGFFFGRYDLRVASNEGLTKGQIKIMELNGAGSEPSHIYHPGFSFFEAQKVLFHHWRALYKISKQNKELGIPYATLKQGIAEYKKIKALDKLKRS